jgi:predicted small metal-binding protein
MTRKFVDCWEAPSDVNCSLAIYGEEDEVVKAAVAHAKSVHGMNQPDDELAQMIRGGLKDAVGTA